MTKYVMLLLLVLLSANYVEAATTYYEVYRSETNDPSTAIRIKQWLTEANCDDDSVVAGTHYYYWIRALACETKEGNDYVASKGWTTHCKITCPIKTTNGGNYTSPVKCYFSISNYHSPYSSKIVFNDDAYFYIRDSDYPLFPDDITTWVSHIDWASSSDIWFYEKKWHESSDMTQDVDLASYVDFGQAEVYLSINYHDNYWVGTDGGEGSNAINVTIQDTPDSGPAWHSISQGAFPDKIHLLWNSVTIDTVCSEIDYLTPSAEGWTGNSQPVYFADANLKAAVETALGITNPTENDMLNLTYLNASQKGITDLTGVEYAINLTELHLAGNELTSIPESIGNLNKLKSLFLYGNKYASLPDSLWNLTNLIHLNLGSNILISIPESIGNLTSLTFLAIGGEQLDSIPESIWNLNNLEDFRLVDSQLTSIPESIGNLNNLTKIVIGNTQLTSIPESIKNLSKLHSLYIVDNPSITLPEFEGNLVNLMDIIFKDNEFTTLPESIMNLNQLVRFDVVGNQLNTNFYCNLVPVITTNNPLDYGPGFTYDPNPNPLTNDCSTSLSELTTFSFDWLDTNCNSDNNWCGGSDLDHDGSVNLEDFAEFAKYWMMR